MTGISNSDNYITQYFFRKGEQTKSQFEKLKAEIQRASGEIPAAAVLIKNGVKQVVGTKLY